MKEFLTNFFEKKEDYYDMDSSDVEKESVIEDNDSSSCKKLRKENEKLKEGIKKQAVEKFKTRRSIRKFSSQKVEWEVIYDILEGSINAPCAGNIQNYNIVVVTDENERRELGKIAFQQYWLSEAPVVLVVVRDNFRLMQLYPQEGEYYAVQNSAALIENILMLTHFHDLGACWVEAYDNGVLKDFLKIPPEKTVDAIIPIGYPLEVPTSSKDPLDTKLFFNKFGDKDKKFN